jgi:hypothetical protein
MCRADQRDRGDRQGQRGPGGQAGDARGEGGQRPERGAATGAVCLAEDGKAAEAGRERDHHRDDLPDLGTARGSGGGKDPDDFVDRGLPFPTEP